MNKVYRSVWSAARQAYVVASENTRSKGKPCSASVVAGVAALVLVGMSQPVMASCNVVAASTTACELDDGENATISTNGSITIDSSAPVGAAVTVNFNQTAGFITNDGTLTASDGASGVLLEIDSSATLLTNRGTINAIGGDGISIGLDATLNELSNGPGIAVGGQGIVGSITSNGGKAIFSAGTITTLTNTGTIEGTGANSYGLYLTGDAFINTLTNSGTIRGVVAGVYLDDAAVNDPRISTFRNSGTIEGGTYAVRSTTPFGIQNIEIQGNNTARFIGQVLAPNTKITVGPSATYTLRSTDDFRTFGFENFGTVLFDNTTPTFNATHITEGFRNYGVLSLTAGQQATLTGNFLQFNDTVLGNGVIRVNVTDDNTYGQLNVDGDITLPSNARFDVNVADPNFQFTLSPLFSVINAVGGGTLTWDESHVTTDNSVLFDFIPMIDWAASSNSIMLEIVAASNNGGGAGNAVSTTGNRVASGAAAVIDDLSAAFAGGGTGNAELDSFIGSLGTLTSDAQLAAAVESTLPVLQGAAPRVNLNTQMNMAQAIQGRQHATLGLSAGDAFVDQHLWVKPFGSWGDQKNRNGAQGYDSETYGVMVGIVVV